MIFLPMTYSVFLGAAKIYRTLRRKGITIRNSVDCMIASVAIENDILLLHNDRDFHAAEVITRGLSRTEKHFANQSVELT
jgi:predicted nucleic acid-binding protein